jgi:NAD(P)-dependent dehydrogenase (short-subunit alcohol dehydrogenase family)
VQTNDTRFAGQTALVTGAASGIGRATAALLARQGARVVVADLDEAGIAQTVGQIEEDGAAAIGQRLDVTSESIWDAAIGRLEQRWGRLDILVNCAGVAFVKSVVDMGLDEWRRVFAVNLDGVFLGTQAGMRSMRKTGGGSIVNVASASGIKAAPSSSAYCASKAAVIMFTKAAALECVNDKIRINAVAPAGVKTPMWQRTPGAAAMTESEQWKAPADGPIGKRFAEPLEIARAIAFLASADASYMTGSVLTVDAGYTTG